ncbi:MAG: hypothetical protein WAU02_03075, partial [Candidatus Saccharimonadales bacterium]
MERKNHTSLSRTPRGAPKAFAAHVHKLTRRFVKSTPRGRHYFVIPVPSRKRALQIALVLCGLAVASIAGYQAYRYFGPHDYRVSAADVLLSAPNDILASSLKFDDKKQLYNFSHGIATASESRQTGASLTAATIPIDASKGVTVTDPTYKVDLTMTPRFAVAPGK